MRPAALDPGEAAIGHLAQHGYILRQQHEPDGQDQERLRRSRRDSRPRPADQLLTALAISGGEFRWPYWGGIHGADSGLGFVPRKYSGVIDYGVSQVG